MDLAICQAVSVHLNRFHLFFLCARRVRVPTHEKCSPHITNISITVLRDPLDVSNRGVYTISMHYVAHSCIC